MGSSYAQGLFILLAASMLVISMGNKPISGGSDPWHSGFNYSTNWPSQNFSFHHNVTRGSNKIIVGGSEHWHYGFNYTDWALKNGPFYLNDTLVFKYDPPSSNTFNHSVYLLPNFWSYLRCDLRGARVVANVSQGGGEGFEFVLKKWQPHFFACGEHNGLHCKDGLMKFFIMPLFPPFYRP